MGNRKGEIYTLICVFVLIIMTLFSIILTFSSAVAAVRIQKDNAQIVFDSFIAENSILIYNNIKQGNNAMQNLNTSAFYTGLKSFCTLDEKDGRLYSLDANGGEKYSLTQPQINFIDGERLELYATYTMFVPIKFAGATVSTAAVPVKIRSALTGKSQEESR